MSLKSLSKTRWKIEPNGVTIYPYGIFYVFTAILAVFFTGLIILYITYQNTSITESLPVVLFFVLMLVAFWSFGGTYIQFDNRKGTMRKMLFGFLPTTTIPLAQLQGIKAVTTLQTYKYHLFLKDAQYGKGIVVSSGFSKNDDPNAIAFVNEAVPLIHSYLDRYNSPADYVAEQITAYRFFEQDGHVYAIKSKKVGLLVFGAIF
ncbi:hypothetical protein [Mucilaginibacter paludis]|nr:hypothetical protein [Mucilaginibacter paludis]